MHVGRKLQDLAAGGAIAAIRRQRRAARAHPAPVLPRAWVETVLADLVAVDVERWRRFDGALVRTDRNGDAHWRLELSRDPGPQTVAQLSGTLVLTHDGTSGVDPWRFPATVRLLRTRAGWIEATIEVDDDGGARVDRRQRGALRVPAPPREGVSPPPHEEAPGMAGDTPAKVPRRWDGFPGPLTDVRPAAELEAVIGGTVRLEELAAVSRGPDELLLPVSPLGGDAPRFVLRVRADGPLEDHAPDYVSGEWNRAEDLGGDFVIERCTAGGGGLLIGGAGWQVDLRAPGLRASVERLV